VARITGKSVVVVCALALGIALQVLVARPWLASFIQKRRAASLLRSGMNKHRAQDWNGAIADYSEALRLSPELADAFYWRGIARTQTRDYQDAIADFNETLRLRPKDANAFCDRGTVKETLHDDDGAIADFDEALRLAPHHYRARADRGRTLAHRDLDAALADLDVAVREAPNDGRILLSRAHVRLARLDVEGALADCNLALGMNRKDASSYQSRAFVLERKGDFRGALHDYNEALALSPKWAVLYRGRGLTKAMAGDRAGAISDYTSAHGLNPGDAYPGLWIVGLGGDPAVLDGFADKDDWLSNIAGYYRGRISRDELLRIARSAPTEREKREHLCEAQGYIGLLAERDGDPELARASYKACLETKVTTFVEYGWSEARLRELR
jgi:tetratricopeptide (TPR) repeat protein